MTNSETWQIIISVIVSFMSYCFGMVTAPLEFLLWCISADIFVGTLASFINPKLYFNSRKFFRGVAKKVVMLSIVAFTYHLDLLMHTDIIAMTTTYYFIINEAFSCLENACKCGLDVPPIIKNSLEQLKGLTNNENKNN